MRNLRGAGGAAPRTRMLPIVLLSLAIPLALHCGGSDDTTQPPPERPTFTSTATPEAANLVRISEGVGVRSDLIEIEVTIGGPSTSTDIYAFGFDIVFGDPSLVAPYQWVPGDVFSGDPVADKTAVVSATIIGDRVAVGVTKLGAVPGEGVDADGATIITITFQTLDVGSTTLRLENGFAYDSSRVLIGSITFDASTATITQP